MMAGDGHGGLNVGDEFLRVFGQGAEVAWRQAGGLLVLGIEPEG